MKRKPFVFLCSILLTIALTIVFHIPSLSAESPSLSDYTAYPPFVDQAAVPPNVLLLLDNSGSMYEFAYKTPGTSDSSSNPDTSFDPSYLYYGYFNSGSKYSYSTSSGGYFYENSGGTWDGNFLNWLTMRRIDVVRKVLVGGKAINRANPSSVKYLVSAEDPDRNFYKRVTSAGSYTPFSGSRCFMMVNNGSLAAIFVSSNTGGSCSSFTAGTYSVKVEVGIEEPLGVVHKTWDKVRFGLMFFEDFGSKFEDGGSGRDGGYVADWVAGPGPNVNLVTHIENTDPTTWTPLAEAFYEATRFFRAGSGAYAPRNYAAHDPINKWCQKNFILVLTDGESTKDRNIPGGAWGTPVSDPDGFNVKTYMDAIASNEGVPSQWDVNANSSQGTYYLEGVAYWAHTTDLRKDWENTQNLITYTVFAFDESPVGRDLLQKTAKYGAFEDLNGNNKPDLQPEWDRNGDGIPDTFFEAKTGSELEARLLEAIVDILRRTASGTAVSVLATTGEGEGVVYQAYFYPSKTVGLQEFRWLGYLQSLFVDAYGNLRDDTNRNKRLDGTETDLIMSMWYDHEQKKVMVDRFLDVDGNGILDCVDTNNDSRIDTCDKDRKFDTIFFEEINPIWEAGDLLFSRALDTRKIYTTVDGSTFLSGGFTAPNASTLRPYLRAASTTEATDIISYIRGTDITGYRSRTFTIHGTTNTWKLGDIVYSTPSVVGKPSENFDIIYSDSTYATFRTKYKNRRQVVYVGANDGMLHAFNAGFYDATNHQFLDTTGHVLGEELWAFIPRDLLPHLKWLTDLNYTHVYYVDLKPRITDVRIFSEDATHPGGWGTILIGGMRYGGKKIGVSDASFPGGSMTFYSSYFALDITEPLEPRLLWTFSDTASPDDLGLTFSYPSIVRIKTDPSKSNSEDPGRWFDIFGSGPTAYDGSSSNTGRVYALDISSGAHGVISNWSLNSNYWKFSTGDSNGFMADAISVDVNRDYVHDVVYIGDTYKGANWQGKMFRLVTKNSISPANWVLSTLFNAGKPITSSSSAAKDRKNNLWVFFGTGRFLDQSDETNTDQQAFYGIKDVCKPWIPDNYSCTTTVAQADLLDVSNAVVTVGSGTVTGVSGVTNWVTLLGATDSRNGWYQRFPIPGERDYVKPLVISGLVVWATYLPSTDVCSPEGNSYVYAVYYETGTAYTNYVFIEEKTTQPDIVGRLKYLGRGAPSCIVGMVTKIGKVKGFAQTSTGAIKEFGFEPAEKSYGFRGWKMGGIR